MIRTAIARGLTAGLFAGVLAGLFALAFAEPVVDAAIVLEDGAATDAAATDHPAAAPRDADHGLTRSTQKFGLVVGTTLYGGALGALFGVAAAWATGRLAGDAWQRARTLGLTAVAALVLLPALKYPPNPSAVGDPATAGSRAGAYLALCAAGVALAAAAWAAARRLTARGWTRPVVHTVIGVGLLVVVTALLTLLPAPAGAGDFPADLLWSFRLRALATQVLLLGGTAVGHGLLTARPDAPSGVPA